MRDMWDWLRRSYERENAPYVQKENETVSSQINRTLFLVDGLFCNNERARLDLLVSSHAINESFRQAGLRHQTRILTTLKDAKGQPSSTGWFNEALTADALTSILRGRTGTFDLTEGLELAARVNNNEYVSAVIIIAGSQKPWDAATLNHAKASMNGSCPKKIFVLIPTGTPNDHQARLRKAAKALGAVTCGFADPSEPITVCALAGTGHLPALAAFADTLKTAEGRKAFDACLRGMPFPPSVTQVLNGLTPKSNEHYR